MNSLNRLIMFLCIIFLFDRGNGLSFVTVGSVDGSNVFECGIKASFSCYSSETPFNVILRVNNTQAVTCFISCLIGSAAPPIYTYTFNISAGLATVHVNSLSIAEENTVFKCEKGNQSLTQAPKIKVFPKNGTTSMIIKNNSITVTTGCTRLENTLIFNWYKLKNKTETDAVFIKSTNPVRDNTNCIPSDHCEGTGFSSTYSVDQDTDGTPYYIKCVVDVSDSYGQDVVLISNNSFFIKDTTPIDPNKKSGLTNKDIIIISVVITVVVIAFLPGGLVLWCFLYRRNKATDAPETPASFELVRDSVAEKTATFRCRPRPYAPGKQEIVLFCHQQGITDNHTAEKTLTVSDPAPLTVYLRIDSLKMGCVYDCYVFSRSNNRKSATSNKIMIKTLGLPDKPTDLKVVKVETNSIQLSWIPGRYRMNEQRFILELQNMKSGDETVDIITSAKDIPFSHTVELLPAGTKFLISLHAKNDVGASGCVGPVEVTTAGNPDPPSELKETAVTPSSITICWKPGGYRRQTQSFVIEYGRAKKKFENISWKQKTKDDDLQPLITYKLNKLRPGTKYAIVIFARNDIGMSYRTEPLLVITKENNHGGLRELRI